MNKLLILFSAISISITGHTASNQNPLILKPVKVHNVEELKYIINLYAYARKKELNDKQYSLEDYQNIPEAKVQLCQQTGFLESYWDFIELNKDLLSPALTRLVIFSKEYDKSAIKQNYEILKGDCAKFNYNPPLINEL